MSTWHVLDDSKVQWKGGDGPTVKPTPTFAPADAPVDDDAPVDADAPEEGSMDVEKDPAVAPLDVSSLPDELKHCIDIGFRYFRTAEDVPHTRHNDNKLRKRFRPSLFPPTAEEAASMRLELCMRCVPQDEDTGGFFVATLRKKPKPAASTDAASAVAVAVSAPVSAADVPAPTKNRNRKGNNEYQVWDEETFNMVSTMISI